MGMSQPRAGERDRLTLFNVGVGRSQKISYWVIISLNPEIFYKDYKFQMKAHSKGKNYFQRSVAQSVFRSMSGDKTRQVPAKTGENSMKIGKYKVLLDEELGKGYSCSVYKGVEEGKTMKRYAIKIIELKNFSSSCLELFERQIDIHKSLRHDNIVRCYDVIRTKTHIYLVMEYCPHGDLASYIQQQKKLSQPNIADIMTQILSAYNYLAKLGILHRDLKPANVLRSGKVWKISDFGFSIRSGSFIDSLNVGTPLYMPLESLSRSYYSVKTDIFALGVIMYELVHGHTPWECESESELMRRLPSEKLTIKRNLANSKLKEFILKCCQFNEDKRLSKFQLEAFDFTFSYGGTDELTKDLFTHSHSYHVKDTCPKQDFVSNNNAILLSYLNHCKFVYYMIQHIDCYLLPPEQKNMFLMVLLKYLLKIARTLADGRFVSQRLIQFDEYKVKDHYALLQQEIEETAAKYEKTYLQFIKYTDVKTIRAVNTQFKEFTSPPHCLAPDFYSRLAQYLGSVLRASNEGLGQVINNARQEQGLSEKLQAFNSLIVLLRYVDKKGKGDSINFTADGLSDYGESKLKKIDYLNLRKEVKNF